MRFINPSRNGRAGFSLVEVLIATSLSVMLFAAIFSSFLFMARSSMGIANYSEMTAESRRGLEIFGRDVRSAQDIHNGFSTTTGFSIVVPLAGGGSETVSYFYLPNHPDRPLMRKDASGERPIMTGIRTLNFNYYNLQGQKRDNMAPMEVKQLQLQLTLVRTAVSLDNTERVVSARFILRNKKVSQ